MKTVYVLMTDVVVLGVYSHNATARAYMKKYEEDYDDLVLLTIHPEDNVIFDLNEHLETEELAEDIEDEEIPEEDTPILEPGTVDFV